MTPKDSILVCTEMYQLIAVIELALHRHIKDTFIKVYGEVDWWRKGVPENIRAECAAARERDPQPAPHAFCYTTFIQLKEILKNRWNILSGNLPGKLATDKQYFLSCLQRLNEIRNCVMHPVRNTLPGEEEFVFAREFRDYLDRERFT